MFNTLTQCSLGIDDCYRTLAASLGVAWWRKVYSGGPEEDRQSVSQGGNGGGVRELTRWIRGCMGVLAGRESVGQRPPATTTTTAALSSLLEAYISRRSSRNICVLA